MLIRELGLEEKVILLGFREDMPEIISCSDIIVHTSYLPEPFGRDIIEGMSCGKPVICTNIGGPQEIITPKTGIMIEPQKPEILLHNIMLLSDDDHDRKALGVEARKRVEELFDIRKTTRQLEGILMDLTRRH